MSNNCVSLNALLHRIRHCGTLGHYIFRVVGCEGIKANSISASQRYRCVHFVKYIIDAHENNLEPKISGDITLREYVYYLAETSLPKSIQRSYRSGCYAVMLRAWEAATADGQPVGAKPVVRPKSDKRAGASASTLSRLRDRGEMGSYLATALNEQTQEGRYKFPPHAIALVRPFVKYLDLIDPERELRSTDCLGKNLRQSYVHYMMETQNDVVYRQRCIRAVDRLLRSAMARAAFDGLDVGDEWRTSNSHSALTTRPGIIALERKLSAVEEKGPLYKQLVETIRGQGLKLRSASLSSTLRDLRILFEYVGQNERLQSFADFQREELVQLLEKIRHEYNNEYTARRIWRTTKRIFEAACRQQGAECIPWPRARWIGGFQRRGNSDQGLGPSECAKVERLARQEVEEVLARRDALGKIFPGPFIEDIQPFEILLAFRTGFNPSTLRTLKLADIDWHEDVVEIRGHKARSTIQPLAVFPRDDRQFSGKWLVEKILSLTLYARSRAAPHDRDALFLYEPKGGAYRGSVLKFRALKTGPENAMLADFGRRAGVGKMTLKTMRASFSNLAFVTSGDDPRVVQRMLGHRSTETTEEYSRSHNVAPRQELLAVAMERRLRDARTQLRQDSRDRPTATTAAATPGFSCLDPFSPPVDLHQQPGMCAAYGACPACPLAAVDTTLSSSACDLVLLAAAIAKLLGTQQLDPRRVGFWREQLAALESVWLPKFADNTIAQAMLGSGPINRLA
ncbi:phage integrase family protein [Phreatobacter oligotrophus]|uniref:Phage integrase family protein n=2 Tax=Phreatobacter oligotrophus TaxID=1122261 RepID=A0A2T4YXJ2_9HYPH|nr:phage integrase family protein [Phreatobacter oligotrophus]